MKDSTLLDYWLILYKRKKTIYAVILSAMVSAAVLSFLLPNTYEGKCVFFIPKQPNTLTFYSNGNGATRTILEPQVQEESHAPYLGFLKSGVMIERISERYPQKPIGRFKKDVDFSLNDEYMLEVYVRDRDPKLAADIANTYPEVLNEMLAELSLEPTVKNLRTIETQIRETKKKLSESQKNLKEFQEKNKVYFMTDETAQLVAMKAGFEKSLDDSVVSLKEITREIISVDKQLKKESSIYEPGIPVTTTPLIEDLQKQLVDLEIKIAGTRGNLTESHPTVVSLKEQYTRIKDNLDKEVDKFVKSQIKVSSSFYETLRQNLVNLTVKKETVNARISALKKTISDAEGRIKKIYELSAKIDELTRESERNKTLYEKLSVELAEVRAQKAREMQVVIIADKASPPKKPIFPIWWLNMLIAGILGTIMSVFLSFFMHYLDSLKEDKREIILGEDSF